VKFRVDGSPVGLRDTPAQLYPLLSLTLPLTRTDNYQRLVPVRYTSRLRLADILRHPGFPPLEALSLRRYPHRNRSAPRPALRTGRQHPWTDATEIRLAHLVKGHDQDVRLADKRRHVQTGFAKSLGHSHAR
jgi:hypothetical protein